MTFDLGAADTIRALGFERISSEMPTKTVPTYLKDLTGNVNNVGSMVESDLEAIAALEARPNYRFTTCPKIRRQVQRNCSNRVLPSKQGRLLDFN